MTGCIQLHIDTPPEAVELFKKLVENDLFLISESTLTPIRPPVGKLFVDSDDEDGFSVGLSHDENKPNTSIPFLMMIERLVIKRKISTFNQLRAHKMYSTMLQTISKERQSLDASFNTPQGSKGDKRNLRKFKNLLWNHIPQYSPTKTRLPLSRYFLRWYVRTHKDLVGEKIVKFCTCSSLNLEGDEYCGSIMFFRLKFSAQMSLKYNKIPL